jgi:hypothetical protein
VAENWQRSDLRSRMTLCWLSINCSHRIQLTANDGTRISKAGCCVLSSKKTWVSWQ